jgi:KaiC/GvpD/RAD55 family RecA-like ATPase
MPRIPIIEDLTKGPIPEGNQLLVEFDPGSQWYNASAYMAAGWLKTGGSVAYNCLAQSPDQIRLQLGRLGLKPVELEKEDRLRIIDWYSTTLGQKSTETYYFESLKVHDLSIYFLKEMQNPEPSEFLAVADNLSVQARFNEERAWIEYRLTRADPVRTRTKNKGWGAVSTETHSTWAYKQLEAGTDGIIDFKLETSERVGEESRSLVRIRFMRNVGFDGRWYPLKMSDDFEITLDK